MLHVRRILGVSIVLLVLDACSGGQNSAPAVSGLSAAATPAGPLITATVQIAFAPTSTSAKARKPTYISPSAKSLGIVVNGAAPIVVNVSTCALSATIYTCSVPIAAPPGPITVAVSLYDAPSAAGTILGMGSGSIVGVVNGTNAIPVAVSAVVGSVAVGTISYTTGTGFLYGTTASATVDLAFSDPDGNVLPIGTPLVSAVTATPSDATTTLTPSTFPAVVASVALAYNGSTSIAQSTTMAFKYGSATVGTSAVAISALVTTYAGNGTAGLVNGPAASAEFNNPTGLAVDSSGNVFVADDSSNVIQEISPAGVVSTFAGTGSVGFTNGAATAATFNHSAGVTVDGSGNVYVADQYNHAIRKIAGGAVTTLAGSGSAGFANGIGAAAKFYYPQAVAVDSSGNVYVADTYNYRIREVTPSGVVTTLAGNGTQGYVDGPAASAEFNGPGSLAVDVLGDVYVTDNNYVRKITPAGVVSTLAGNAIAGFADATGSAAKFSGPYGLALDSNGNLYVGDQGNQRIRKVTAAGVVTTFAGNGTSGIVNGPALSAEFYSPFAVALDAIGNVYVDDRQDNIIQKISP